MRKFPVHIPDTVGNHCGLGLMYFGEVSRPTIITQIGKLGSALRDLLQTGNL